MPLFELAGPRTDRRMCAQRLLPHGSRARAIFEDCNGHGMSAALSSAFRDPQPGAWSQNLYFLFSPAGFGRILCRMGQKPRHRCEMSQLCSRAQLGDTCSANSVRPTFPFSCNDKQVSIFGLLSSQCTLSKASVRIIVPHLHCFCAWDLQFLRDDMVTIVPACCKMLSASRSICSQQFRQVSDSWRCRHGARCGSFA